MIVSTNVDIVALSASLPATPEAIEREIRETLTRAEFQLLKLEMMADRGLAWWHRARAGGGHGG